MRKTIKFILMGLVGALLLEGCSFGNSNDESLSVDIGTTTVKLNSTTLNDLINDGFTYVWDTSQYEEKDTVSAESYLPVVIDIEKDDIIYAEVSLINTSSSEVQLEDCKIGDVVLYENVEGWNSPSELVVEENNLIGLSRSEVEEMFDVDKLTSTDDGSLTYSCDGWSYVIYFDDSDIVNGILYDLDESNIKE